MGMVENWTQVPVVEVSALFQLKWEPTHDLGLLKELKR
jgi:hypothetical protein